MQWVQRLPRSCQPVEAAVGRTFSISVTGHSLSAKEASALICMETSAWVFFDQNFITCLSGIKWTAKLLLKFWSFPKTAILSVKEYKSSCWFILWKRNVPGSVPYEGVTGCFWWQGSFPLGGRSHFANSGVPFIIHHRIFPTLPTGITCCNMNWSGIFGKWVQSTKAPAFPLVTQVIGSMPQSTTNSS